MKEDFLFSFDELVSSTLLVSANVIDLHGYHRKDLIAKWRETFTSVILFEDRPIDWSLVRALFWRNIQKKVMTDKDFRRAIDSILVEIYGDEEGTRGLEIIFAPQFRYKE